MEEVKVEQASIGICAVQPEIAVPVMIEGVALSVVCNFFAVAAG